MAHLANNAISFFKRTVVAFERSWTYAPDIDDVGRNIKVDDPHYNVVGVLQPASNTMLMALPEGQRRGVEWLFHSKDEFKIATQGENQNTYMLINGKEYKIIRKDDYSQWSIYRYFLQNVESNSGR